MKKEWKECKGCARVRAVTCFQKRVRTMVAKYTGETYTSTSYNSRCFDCEGSRLRARLVEKKG